MNMIKKTISPYNKTLSILAICFCLVLAFVLLCPSMQVYADFSDINENALVNFNQIVPNEYINHTYAYVGLNTIANTTIIASHKYYVRLTNNSNATFDLLFGNDWSNYRIALSVSGNSQRDTIFTYGQDLNGFACYPNESNTYITNLNIIDLTKMFGESFEPSLEQAREYFTAEYYNYNEGTQIPFSKSYLQGYQDGANDVWESLTTTFNNDILGTITYPSSVEGFDSNVAYDSQHGYYLVEGLAMLDLGSPITSQVNYKGEYFIPNYVGGGYIAFFKYEGNVLTPIIVSEIAWTNTSNFVDITFNINNVQQLYFGFFNSPNTFNNDTSFTMYCWSSELEIKTIDVLLLTQSAYARGVYETNKEYSEGGAKYETIFNLGKAEAIAEQNGYATGLDVIATTFTQVFSIFNIEILPGIPLTIFILLPLLVGLIMFIVKMTKGE